MSLLLTLMGIPGSGKTKIAEDIRCPWGNEIITYSSDKLREELFGDVNDQSHNTELFTELHRRVKKNLSEGINVIYDATNLNKKKRRSFLKELSGIDCVRICAPVMAPIEQCIAQNNWRYRTVPMDVIDRMYKNWQPPGYEEGWDVIQPVYNYGNSDGKLPSKYNLETLFSGENGIDRYEQHNSHHTLTLG